MGHCRGRLCTHHCCRYRYVLEPTLSYCETQWAFHLGAVAVALTYAAFWFKKWFKAEDPRSEFFAFAALAMVSYGVSVILTETALTLTLAGMTLLTAILDRRYGMKLLRSMAYK